VVVFPTTIGQQGFWYLDQMDQGNPAYNIAVRFRLQGLLRVEPLTHALNEVVARHEALRTIIGSDDGIPVQLVAPALAIPLPVDDLRGLPANRRDSRAEALTVDEARRTFELSKGPLVRARLLRLNDEEHVLLVTVHHVIADGWSIGVITQELGALYEAFRLGLPSPLPELSLQFGDFAVWQRPWLESPEVSRQLDYWTGRLASLPLLEVPPDKLRPEILTSAGHIESMVLPRPLTDALIDLGKGQGATFFMVALATLKILLQRSTGLDDIYVGSLVAGRPRVQVEPLIGMFVNPIVFRSDLSGNPTFVELLVRVRESVLEGLAHQDYPFERIVAAIHPRRDRSRHPVFQVNFIFQRDFVRPLHTSGLTLTSIPSRSPGAIYDLNFFMVERADGWRWSCEYNTNLYEPATVTGMLRQFQALLEAVVATPSARIADLPMPAVRAPRAPRRPSTPTAIPGGAGDRQVAAGMRSEAPLPGEADEARLMDIWEQVLGSRPSRPDADFFDEGGHSLLAARLLARIHDEFGKRIPLAAFLQSPTIRAIAQRLGDNRRRLPGDHVHPVQPDGEEPPFFVVTSQPLLYRELARKLGRNQPLLALTWPELDELPDGFTTEEIASYLVAVLREVQADGPYYLGGWCMSGVVVFVMAQQLRAQGQEVALVTLFDTNSPAYLRSVQGWRKLPMRIYLTMARRYDQLRQRPIESLLKLSASSWSRLQALLHSCCSRLSRSWAALCNRPLGDDLLASMELLSRVVADHEPGPYDGPVFLFRSARYQTGKFRDPEMGWGKLVRGGLTVYEIPAGHEEMFHEPAVDILAAYLLSLLRGPAQVPGASGPTHDDVVARPEGS
jgi:thioesterase domain-containing protein